MSNYTRIIVSCGAGDEQTLSKVAEWLKEHRPRYADNLRTIGAGEGGPLLVGDCNHLELAPFVAALWEMPWKAGYWAELLVKNEDTDRFFRRAWPEPREGVPV